MSRVDILEGKSLDVNNTDCNDGNARQAKPQHKNRVIRDCVSMAVELPPVAATDVDKAATIPVENDTTTATSVKKKLVIATAKVASCGCRKTKKKGKCI